MTTTTVLKPFDKVDWYGWAGATKFADGSEPMIAYVEKPGGQWTIIADGEGIGAIWYEGDDESTEDNSGHLPLKNKHTSVALAEYILKQDISKELLLEMGFLF